MPPTDTHALLRVADSVDVECRLLHAAMQANVRHTGASGDKIRGRDRLGHRPRRSA